MGKGHGKFYYVSDIKDRSEKNSWASTIGMLRAHAFYLSSFHVAFSCSQGFATQDFGRGDSFAAISD